MRWRPPASIHTRLTLWYTGALLTILLVTSGFSYWLLAVALTRDVDPSLLGLAEVIRDSVAAGHGASGALEAAVGLDSEFRDHFVQVVDARGTPTYLSARRSSAAPIRQGSRQRSGRRADVRDTAT